jgi:hypothetical protein
MPVADDPVHAIMQRPVPQQPNAEPKLALWPK